VTEIPIIEIQDLTVIYNENTFYEVVALNNFSMKMKQGDVLVVTGGNGTGKSTLLNSIAGIIPIKSGKIFFNGVDITNWNALKRSRLMGLVHQDTMLGTCPNLTVQENFELTNPNKWWTLSPYKLRFDSEQTASIKKIGLTLENREKTKINMLSGGQRQAIALCLAFEREKPLLLFDEFTSALDEPTAIKVLDYTFEKAKIKNTTMLMVLHNTSTVEKYSINFLRL